MAESKTKFKMAIQSIEIVPANHRKEIDRLIKYKPTTLKINNS